MASRCPDCNKFVSLELVDEPEWNEEEGTPDVSADGDCATVEIEARIVRNCAECGGEMKEANLSIQHEFEVPTEHRGEEHELSWDFASSGVTERTTGKGRGLKTYFGIECEIALTCSCSPDAPILTSPNLTDETNAGSMDELN